MKKKLFELFYVFKQNLKSQKLRVNINKVFNKFISDLRKQPSINRVIVRDQKTLPQTGLIFSIDIKSWKMIITNSEALYK